MEPIVHGVHGNGAAGDGHISIGFQALGGDSIFVLGGLGLVEPARETKFLGVLGALAEPPAVVIERLPDSSVRSVPDWMPSDCAVMVSAGTVLPSSLPISMAVPAWSPSCCASMVSVPSRTESAFGR